MQTDEFMAGHAAKWQGSGDGEVSRSQKSENPDNLSILGGIED